MARQEFKILKSLKIFTILLSLSFISILYTNCAANSSASSAAGQTNNNSNNSGLDTWQLSDISFTAGSGLTYDLSLTLPSCLANKGVFSVDPSGNALPTGMTLSSNGLLSVGSAAVGDTTGVVFACTM